MTEQAATHHQPLIIVAPNGARKSRNDHRALPITPEQMVEQLAPCVDAGIGMVHLHARTRDGLHSLEIDDNAAMLKAVQDAFGEQLVIQLTTEAVGIYKPEQQMKLIRELAPEAASFAIRELVPDEQHYEQAEDFFAWVRSKNIIAQYIVYSAEDLLRYQSLIELGVLPADHHHLLLVLGRYSKGQQSQPIDLLPFLAQAKLADRAPDGGWSLCAFGQSENLCLANALTLGGDVRVGFENNHLRPDGTVSDDNAENVRRIANVIRTLDSQPSSAAGFRARFNNGGKN